MQTYGEESHMRLRFAPRACEMVKPQWRGWRDHAMSSLSLIDCYYTLLICEELGNAFQSSLCVDVIAWANENVFPILHVPVRSPFAAIDACWTLALFCWESRVVSQRWLIKSNAFHTHKSFDVCSVCALCTQFVSNSSMRSSHSRVNAWQISWGYQAKHVVSRVEPFAFSWLSWASVMSWL